MGYLFWGEVWSGNFPIRHSRYIPIPVRVTSFPHLWLSSCGEKNFTTCGNSSCGKKRFHHSWLRHSWWNIFSPRLLNHSWGKSCDLHGNWDVPFVTHGEFSISPTCGFATRGGNSPSPLRLRRALVHFYHHFSFLAIARNKPREADWPHCVMECNL